MRRYYALFSLLPALAVISPAPSYAQLVSITIAPPVLPVYVQPPIPAPGYIWTPGYWAYGPDGYFWVPGTWVMPPSVGVLWTPGYWGWNSGVYAWNAGYWGPTIGFYGGVNYGFGYGGVGFAGGYWAGGVFNYNRSVNNFGNVNITNVYNKTVIVNNNAPRTSFNGGNGGLTARPTPREEAAMREQHIAATATQTQHEHTASTTRENLASVNHGSPTIAATSKAGEFHGAGVVGAHGAAGAAGAGGAGGLAHGPGAIPNNALSNRNTGPLGNTNTGAPKGPGNANSTPNRANALATGGPGGAGGNAPNREFRQGNPGGGNPAGVANIPRGGGQHPAANAAPRPQAPPRAMMAAPPRPQGGAPRPQGGGGGRPAGGNHKPG
jgi:hypothetical protein